MVELATTARPYAEAAFQVALSKGLDQWSQWLRSWATIAGHPDITLLVNDPKLPEAKVLEVFAQLTNTPDVAEAHNFLRALVENGRLLALPEVERQFSELRSAHEGVADAQVETAFPMDDATVAELLPALEKRFGRRLKAAVVVNPDLIGGVRVTVGDQCFDTSVRTRLEEMKAAIVA
jgi:F-type H+-transporting ATPase subunit delta